METALTVLIWLIIFGVAAGGALSIFALFYIWKQVRHTNETFDKVFGRNSRF